MRVPDAGKGGIGPSVRQGDEEGEKLNVPAEESSNLGQVKSVEGELT